MMKPGRKTSEFWTTFGAILFSSVATFSSTSPWVQIAGLVCSALSGMVYTHGRAEIKKAKP